MKRFFELLFIFILMIGLVALCTWLSWKIGESDLPFWIKVRLLR